MARFQNQMQIMKLNVVIILALLFFSVNLLAQESQPEFREMTSTVDNYKIHYLIGGSGPVLLMLHGFTLTGEQWLPFADDFSDSYTVVIADLPGHGGSSPIPGAFSFAKSAQLMYGLLDELDAQQAYGIGHSAGGMTLLHMAAQQPERLQAVVLVSAPHFLGPEAKKIAREDKWELLDPAVQDFYLNLHPGGQKQVDGIFRQYNGLADTGERITPEILAALPVRTLLVRGDRDPAFPLEVTLELYRSLPNAALWIVPQQGHTPLWTDLGGDAGAAANFGEIAKDFLAQDAINKVTWF